MFLAEWTYSIGKYVDGDIRISKWLVIIVVGSLFVAASK